MLYMTYLKFDKKLDQDTFASTLGKTVKCTLDGHPSEFVAERPHYLRTNKNKYPS